MSKVSCEAAGKRRQAPLRMVRAELILLFVYFFIIAVPFLNKIIYNGNSFTIYYISD